jgi:uncharacterized protein with gpF-like domain
MTSQNKKDFLRLFRKFQKAREIYYKPKIQKILQDQVNQYLHHNDLSSIDFKPMFNFLASLYKDVATVWGHKVQLSIKRQAKSRQPIGFSERLFEILKQYYGIDLLQDSMDITQTTKDFIQKILTDAAKTGIGIDEIVKQITAHDFTDIRARKIARTETVRASNIAGDIIARESGLKMNKEWLAVLDARTRSDHIEVHGTIVDQDATFTVGGYQMKFPGDGSGGAGAELIVNCRCVCVYIPKRSDSGALL